MEWAGYSQRTHGKQTVPWLPRSRIHRYAQLHGRFPSGVQLFFFGVDEAELFHLIAKGIAADI
jgi:hypothetical protein